MSASLAPSSTISWTWPAAKVNHGAVPGRITSGSGWGGPAKGTAERKCERGSRHRGRDTKAPRFARADAVLHHLGVQRHAEALGTALAAVAAVVCLGQAVNTEMVQHGIGAGEPWSLGAAAAVAAAAFALAFRRALRRPAPA